MSQDQQKIVIGSEEWCGFPDLGLPAIKARVDSGAKTSSIHAFNIQKFRRRGESWVSFEVHPLQKDRRTVVRCERPILDKRVVKSSSGIPETRYVISTVIQIGTQSWDIELTLANRDSMGYRMLLGREAMSGRAVVDPSLRFCLGKQTRKALRGLYVEERAARNGLKIGLLSSDPDLYSNQRLLEAGEERGHEMVFLNVQQCYMKLDATAPQARHRGGTIIKDLDAVITRLRPGLSFYGCSLVRQFEAMGVYSANSAEAISRSRDKLLTLQLLLEHGIKIPTTGFTNSPIDTGDLIEMIGGPPLIVKLMEGSQGKGVVLAETRNAAESVIDAYKTLGANLLVQEFIKEAGGKDLRCFVVDGEVVAAIQRTAAPGEFRATLHQGGTATVAKVSAEERAVAIKAAETLGLAVAGVDLIKSKGGPLVLDVNPVPGLEGIEAATGKDIAGMVVASVEKQLGWKRELSVEPNQ